MGATKKIKAAGGIGNGNKKHLYELNGQEFLLTIAEQNFCQEYVKNNHVQQAAKAAGYTSEKACYELLKRPTLKSYLAELRKNLSAQLNLTQYTIAKEYAKIALANSLDFFDDKGRVLDIAKLKEKDLGAAISYIKKTNEDVEIDFHSKLTALDRLSKMLGFDAEKPPANSVDINLNFSEQRNNGKA